MATTLKQDQETTSQEPAYKVIGTRPIRHDGVDKVTGRALYGADIHLAGTLYGAVLRSPHAHARLLSIDTRQAQALPGVKAVVTAADLPEIGDKVAEQGEGTANLRYMSHNVLARDKVLYDGHPVAAVAASSVHIAQAALELIQVTYEVLPPVLDVRQAMQSDAPILLAELRTDELGSQGTQPTNIASHLQTKTGDLEKGFQEAAVVVEREFNTATVHQGYLEPQNTTALYNADGQVTIWCSTQAAFGVRFEVSEILQIPVSRIKVIPMEIGGGFGGKIGVYLQPVAVLLSKKSGNHPVKLTMSYHDVLASTGPTPASYIRLKLGADKEGHITAAQATLAYASGAYPGSFIGAGMNILLAPYRIPNVQIDGYDVVVNRPRAAAYRAPGATNAAFAAETVIDELCENLGMDPLEFRLLNGVKEGDQMADGPQYKRIGYLETVQAARSHPHYSAPLGGPNRGRGVASGYWANYGGKSSASASLNADGSVSLLEGSVDIGGSRTSIAMQLAEALEIPVSAVKPQVADTDSVGFTEGTYGSRTTFATGWAVYELGLNLKRKLIERLAHYWEVEPDQVTYAGGIFSTRDKQLTFTELAAKLDEMDTPVMDSATVNPSTYGPAFATHIVDVEVDPETGKVNILRYTAVQDVGKAIHPAYVEGQIQGGAVQGIGWGLNEEYIYDERGRLLNGSLLDYRLPTCLDLPMIETVMVEIPNPGHPYGVRGVGEVPIVPPPAAIANAVYRAVGVRMHDLPMSPARLLENILSKNPV
jgi:xanthine dehydrogenase molybdenum-binding subunit